MSQAKVDRYKEEKKNRKKEVAKVKRKRRAARIIIPVAVIAVAAWIAYSGITFYQEQQPVTVTDVNISAISDYISGL